MDSGRQMATLDERPVGTSRRRATLLSPVVPVALLVLFGLATLELLTHGPMVHLDLTIQTWIADNQHRGWRKLAGLLSHAGTPILDVAVLITVATEVALIRRSWRPLRIACVAAFLLTATVLPAKVLIARPGPWAASDKLDGPGYFPSGHTASTLVCYGTIALLVLVNRWTLLTVAAGSLLVAASMVYCSFHWASDVVAGYLLAATVLWVVYRLFWRGPGDVPDP